MKFDTPEWRNLRDRKLAIWFQGNPEAMRVFHIITDITETWDDIIDRDKPISPEKISSVMESLAIRLQFNPFWREFRAFLEPILVVGLNAWMDATELENWQTAKFRADDVSPHRVAKLIYPLKTLYIEFVLAIVFCTAGWDYLRAHSLEIHLFFHHELINPQWHQTNLEEVPEN